MPRLTDHKPEPPGKKKLIIGVVLLLIGGFILPLSLFLPFILDQSVDDQFLVPGSGSFTVDEPARYYLWHDHQTLFQGSSFNHPIELPNGIQISVYSSAGETLELVNAPSISTSGNVRTRQSIAYADVPSAGEWTVEVKGDFAPRVFSFAESKFLKIFGWIFGGMALCLITAATGLILVVLGVVGMAQKK